MTVIDHLEIRGYGATLATSFQHRLNGGYDVLVTMDCDGQHQLLQEIAAKLTGDASEYDMVSGSRSLRPFL